MVAEFATGVALAIDFGSSNTAAAFRDRHGYVQEIRLSTAGSLMPSAVFYDGSRFLVGRTALQAAFTSPEAFEPSPKRRLADREVFLAGSMIAATEMVAAVFAEVLARASQVMAAAPDVVIVTHPDQWSAPLQRLLAQSACAGGVDRNRLRMVSEAQAAAWFYAMSAPDMAVGARLVVFDFGAGTCDVAVLERQPDHSFAVIASDGLDGLGGHDLDARVQAWVRRQLAASDPVLLAEVNDSAAIATRLALNDRIRDAKEALSEASSAAIMVAATANTQVLQLTRDEFDELIGPDIDRAVGLATRVMAEAQQRRPSDQTPTIYLTGGSSQIPLVHSRLAKLAPVGVLGDPKMVVAQGALYTPEAAPASPPQPPSVTSVTATTPPPAATTATLVGPHPPHPTTTPPRWGATSPALPFDARRAALAIPIRHTVIVTARCPATGMDSTWARACTPPPWKTRSLGTPVRRPGGRGRPGHLVRLAQTGPAEPEQFRTGARPTAAHHHLTFDQLQSPTAQLTTHRLRPRRLQSARSSSRRAGHRGLRPKFRPRRPHGRALLSIRD